MQPGKFQAGDDIIRVEGMQEYLVYRKLGKAPIASLPEDQSRQLASHYVGSQIDGYEMTIEIA
jgi:hypothetical protein